MAEELAIGDYVSFTAPGDDNRSRGYVVYHPKTGELTAIKEDERGILNEMPSDVKKLKTHKDPSDDVAKVIKSTTAAKEMARKKNEVDAKKASRLDPSSKKSEGKGKSKVKPVDKKTRKALGEMFTSVNGAMHAQDWDAVDAILSGIDKKADATILVGVLRGTFLVRNRVSKWYETRDAVRAELESRNEDVQVVMRHLLDVQPAD